MLKQPIVLSAFKDRVKAYSCVRTHFCDLQAEDIGEILDTLLHK